MNKTAQQTTLMTEGSIWKKIIAFAIPLFLGNLFQQLYNMVDTAVVGKFVGEDAVAAVGSSFPIVFLSVAVMVIFTSQSSCSARTASMPQKSINGLLLR